MNQPPSAKRLLQEFLSKPVDAQLGLYTGDALFGEGHFEEAVAVWALADDADPRLRRIKDAPQAPPQARAASARADAAFRSHFTRLHENAIDHFPGAAGVDVSRVRNAIWPMTHDGPVEFRTPLHRPVIFYMPDLPAPTVTSNDILPWTGALESRWKEIRDEYLGAVSDEQQMNPYVPSTAREARWSKLAGRQDWSSFHLYEEGRKTEHAAHFPVTIEALQDVDLVRIDGEPMEVFFSRLKPGAHIPPHYGLTNTRLTTHLALVIPPDCTIRVGSEIHTWTEGRILAFDDSYEHEVWNRADVDRVVLIFEAHHPDLSEAERSAIEHAYSARRHWLAGRVELLQRHLAGH